MTIRIGIRRAVSVIATGLVAAGPAVGQSPESLGTVRFGVSCESGAQASFDRAVALLHHMTYAGARAAFTAIVERHPGCAMAHWGVAMTLFQPLWPTRPTEADIERGHREVMRALEIGAGSERDRLLLSATAAFFAEDRTDYWDRIAAWADGMEAAWAANPDDIETAAFFALSHLAVAPATGGPGQNAEAAAVLQTVLEREPTHPGAIHYTIHANDADGRESESLDVVRRYSEIAPRNPHALHMPTHIQVRLGEWQEVIAGNKQAAEAALENPAGDRGQWVWDEFPHAIEYLVYAYLQLGDDSAALAEMQRVQGTADLQPGSKTAFHLSSIPARYALERRDWVRAARLAPRPHPGLSWEQFPWPEGVTWFARGIGALRTGDIAAAREAESRLAALRDVSERQGEGLFARQTEILRLGVAAWLAHARADNEQAVRLMEQAARLEADTPKPPVTPAPTLPAVEMLGDLLLEIGRPQAALDAYESSLERTPRRFNSLVGAARAAAATGARERAVKHYRELLELAVPGSPRTELAEAARYVGREADTRPY